MTLIINDRFNFLGCDFLFLLGIVLPTLRNSKVDIKNDIKIEMLNRLLIKNVIFEFPAQKCFTCGNEHKNTFCKILSEEKC